MDSQQFFFKVFWNKIGMFVLQSLNFPYTNNAFSVTQKQGIIVCIPKENKPRHFLRNWRPITLLNTVYKIASGSIANRLKPCLQTLISKDQTGFVSGRYIGENTRLLYDIMNYTENNKIPGLIMMIDFEKAFDSLSFDCIEQTLNLFNFGQSFKRLISIFLKITQSSVQLNGFLSESFSIAAVDRETLFRHISLYYAQNSSQLRSNIVKI